MPSKPEGPALTSTGEKVWLEADNYQQAYRKYQRNDGEYVLVRIEDADEE